MISVDQNGKASTEVAAPTNTRKQRRYITKVKNVSKKLIFSDSEKASVPDSGKSSVPEQPGETVALANEETANKPPKEIDDITWNRLKKEKQIRCHNKLKSLVQQQLDNDETTNTTISSTNLQDVIRERSDISKSIPKHDSTKVQKSIQGKEGKVSITNRFSWVQCCTSMENYVDDVFSVDDDIDQLLLKLEDGDATNLDEWSTASSPTKKSLQGDKMDGASTLDGSSKRSSFGSVLFRGDPCEI